METSVLQSDLPYCLSGFTLSVSPSCSSSYLTSSGSRITNCAYFWLSLFARFARFLLFFPLILAVNPIMLNLLIPMHIFLRILISVFNVSARLRSSPEYPSIRNSVESRADTECGRLQSLCEGTQWRHRGSLSLLTLGRRTLHDERLSA